MIYTIRNIVIYIISIFYITSIPTYAQQQVEGRFKWKPPLLPIEFTIDNNGNWGVSIEKSIITPLGKFSLGGSYEKTYKQPNDWLFIIYCGQEKIRIALNRKVDVIIPNDTQGKTRLVVDPTKKLIELTIPNPSYALSLSRTNLPSNTLPNIPPISSDLVVYNYRKNFVFLTQDNELFAMVGINISNQLWRYSQQLSDGRKSITNFISSLDLEIDKYILKSSILEPKNWNSLKLIPFKNEGWRQFLSSYGIEYEEYNITYDETVHRNLHKLDEGEEIVLNLWYSNRIPLLVYIKIINKEIDRYWEEPLRDNFEYLVTVYRIASH